MPQVPQAINAKTKRHTKHTYHLPSNSLRKVFDGLQILVSDTTGPFSLDERFNDNLDESFDSRFSVVLHSRPFLRFRSFTYNTRSATMKTPASPKPMPMPILAAVGMSLLLLASAKGKASSGLEGVLASGPSVCSGEYGSNEMLPVASSSVSVGSDVAVLGDVDEVIDPVSANSHILE